MIDNSSKITYDFNIKYAYKDTLNKDYIISFIDYYFYTKLVEPADYLEAKIFIFHTLLGLDLKEVVRSI